MDRLDLYDDLAQEAFISNKTFAYRNGEKVEGRGWWQLENIQRTFFPFALNLRLKYSEDIFRKKLAAMGTQIYAPSKLTDFVMDDNAPR